MIAVNCALSGLFAPREKKKKKKKKCGQGVDRATHRASGYGSQLGPEKDINVSSWFKMFP